MAEHRFKLQAEWPGGRNNVGSIAMDNLTTNVSIPEEMDGPGEGTNPDEMLLGAASTCYIITLAAMIERSGLPLEEMSMQSEGIVDFTNGVITYKKIIHRPAVYLQSRASDNQLAQLNKLIDRAEEHCMISKAVRGNVRVELEPLTGKAN
ncbi:OsmC family protein [Thalassobacillus sp. CUG 92003]|uniref:OsmC family protein n=1 Tax=Thalassobacillus sp. CUG 92003 TaxID=2736641 RepID=UPI0015E6FD48|nr:OsmC family protein [Thalassobacillus sp. CUG 92003]